MRGVQYIMSKEQALLWVWFINYGSFMARRAVGSFKESHTSPYCNTVQSKPCLLKLASSQFLVHGSRQPTLLHRGSVGLLATPPGAVAGLQ